jgi:hypothetical protein
MKYTKYFAVALGLLMVVAMVQPAQAKCSLARLMTSSYIYTPGTVFTYAESGNTVSDQFQGTWWALGFGSSVSPGGADSGTFPAQEWIANFTDSGYAALLDTHWAADARIDGCIDDTTATCTAVQLTDVNPTTGEPVFALLSAQQDALKNYDFGGGGAITLASLPPVQIANSTRVGDTGIIVDVAALDAAAFDGGLYLDPSCTGAAGGGTGIETFVPGVCWYFQVLARSAQPPSDTNLATGGWVDSGVCSPFGAPAQISVPCTGDSDVYTTYALQNESGIPADHTTGPGTRTECGPNLADPAQRIRVAPRTREVKPMRER